MNCRAGCGACCIALSISSPIPGMPDGKPAGVRCAQLSEDNLCRLFGSPERPEVCVRLRPSAEMCGETAGQALAYLAALERATAPHDFSPLGPLEPAGLPEGLTGSGLRISPP
ncbi:MAG TPA: YkgJ family cysteine cluster protein [Thermoanaerobaculia bacterium]|jgi:hypothetical protein